MKALEIASLSALVIGSTMGCAGSGVPAAAPSSHPASSLTAEEATALYSREASSPLHAVPIAVLEGGVTGTVEATSTPKIRSEENEHGSLVSVVDVPIGTAVPVTCIFRTERLDLGSAVSHMLAHVMSLPEEGEGHFTPDVHVEVSGGVPILVVTSPFVEKGVPNMAKLAVAAEDGGTLLCTHFEPGYRATFTKVVANTVASLRFTSPSPKPRWHEVRLLQKGSSVIFLDRDVFDTAKAGELSARNIAAGFVEIDGHWLGIDAVDRETYENKGGAVLDRTAAFAVAGALVSDIKLTRKGPGEYAYEGKQKDMPLNGTFKTPLPITSQASRAKQVRAWLSGKSDETRFATYDEMENAKGPLDVVFKRTGGRTVTVETHGAKLTTVKCTVDANGMCESEDEAEEGSRETRLFVRGTL